MKCNKCGNEIDMASPFCGHCGAPVNADGEKTIVGGMPPAPNMPPPLNTPSSTGDEETMIGGMPPAPAQQMSTGGDETVFGGDVPPAPAVQQEQYVQQEPPMQPGYNEMPYNDASAQQQYPPQQPAPKKGHRGLTNFLIGLLSCLIAFTLVWGGMYLYNRYANNDGQTTTDQPVIDKQALANAPIDSLRKQLINYPDNADVVEAWLPTLRNKELKKIELNGISKPSLILLGQLIQANYGCKFDDKAATEFFEAYDWYKPSSDDVSSKLTSIEKHNIDIINELAQ